MAPLARDQRGDPFLDAKKDIPKADSNAETRLDPTWTVAAAKDQVADACIYVFADVATTRRS